MTRDVNCWLTNNTGYSSTVMSHKQNHGQGNPLPISASNAQQEIFAFHKTGGSMQGTEGTVIYELHDGTQLFFGFNCPFNPDGVDSNCWFYACLTNIPSSGTSFGISCSVNIDGQPMNPTNPTNGDTIKAYVTLYLL